MSANNWTTCPRCERRREKEQDRLIGEADEAYGKVSAEEYRQLRQKANDGPPLVKDHFREDYELFVIAEGVLTVIYHGWCQDCGYGVDYRHTQVVEGLDD